MTETASPPTAKAARNALVVAMTVQWEQRQAYQKCKAARLEGGQKIPKGCPVEAKWLECFSRQDDRVHEAKLAYLAAEGYTGPADELDTWPIYGDGAGEEINKRLAAFDRHLADWRRRESLRPEVEATRAELYASPLVEVTALKAGEHVYSTVYGREGCFRVEKITHRGTRVVARPVPDGDPVNLKGGFKGAWLSPATGYRVVSAELAAKIADLCRRAAGE